MTAEIICVGTELLLGDTVNTDAAYAARKLAQLGIDMHFQVVVGDNSERLLGCIRCAYETCDMILLTGGLGPTYDDLTKEVVSEYFGRRLLLREDLQQRICDMLARSGMKCTANNYKQALVPEGATVFPNGRGTAPGLAIEQHGKLAILLPGPPSEMEPMMDEQIVPFLMERTHRTIMSSNIHFFGLGESAVEDALRADMECSVNPTIAPYAKEGEVIVRVTAAGDDSETCRALIEPVVASIRGRFPDNVYGVDVEGMQYVLVSRLRRSGRTIAIAESCTGGMLSSYITDVPGASDVFKGGVVSYANSAKEDLLGVSEEVLRTKGAVSAETATQMAEGARTLLRTDFGLSTTGIAGPGGGTPDKPVGTVYIAICGPEGTVVRELHLARTPHETRARIRRMATLHALFLALETVPDEKEGTCE